MDTSAKSPVSLIQTAMTVGAMTAASMLIAFALPGLQVFGWIVFFGGIYYGMKRFRKESGGYISYIKALSTGVGTAFFASVILAFAMYLITTMEPSLIDITLDMMDQQLKASSIPPGLAELTMQQWREALSPGVLATITIFVFNAIGCIAGLISALFVQKDLSRLTR